MEVACVRAELSWGAPGANLGWELGEIGGWEISSSGFSLALLPFAVGVSTAERRECGPPAWLPVPVCLCCVDVGLRNDALFTALHINTY